MYTYIKGIDDHFIFERHGKRTEAESILEKELALYEICYKDSNPECGVLTDSDFYIRFPEFRNSHTIMSRRLGNRLIEYIEEFDRKSK